MCCVLAGGMGKVLIFYEVPGIRVVLYCSFYLEFVVELVCWLGEGAKCFSSTNTWGRMWW